MCEWMYVWNMLFCVCLCFVCLEYMGKWCACVRDSEEEGEGVPDRVGGRVGRGKGRTRMRGLGRRGEMEQE